MESIRIRNLRCIADSGLVTLSPITILLGANSSGKSSLLRVLPLLRQTFETQTASGLLLNEPYVDYGLFTNAVSKNAKPAILTLEFGLKLQHDPSAYYLRRAPRLALPAESPWPVNAAISFAPRPSSPNNAYINRVVLTLGNEKSDSVTLVANEEGQLATFEVNEIPLHTYVTSMRLVGRRGPIPSLEAVESETDSSETSLMEEVLKATGPYFHGNTSQSRKIEIINSVGVGPRMQMLHSWRQAAARFQNTYLIQALTESVLTTKTFNRARSLIIADRIPELMAHLGKVLGEFSRGIHYFMPVRANVVRDYLSRDIQVDDVDPRGDNIAMFINNLSKEERGRLSEWTNRHFGFRLEAKPTESGSRVALRLKEPGSGEEFNLADMGFGYSQMLPFIIQIWAVSKQSQIPQGRTTIFRVRSRSVDSLLAIEQPELHLHPALQARVADLFASVVGLQQSDEGIGRIRFLVETHSSTLIERLGHLIASGRLPSSAVQVLVFSRKGDAPADIRRCTYDSNGVLSRDFPPDFFLPPMD